jgi:hypothetical protein
MIFGRKKFETFDEYIGRLNKMKHRREKLLTDGKRSRTRIRNALDDIELINTELKTMRIQKKNQSLK